METTIYDIAEEQGYEIVETTSEVNGYPRNLKKVIIGFLDFSEAEHFAKSNGGEIIELSRKAGQQLWSRGCRRYEPYDMRKVYENVPNCEMYFCGDEERFTELVKTRVAELDDFALIRKYIEDVDDAWSAISSLWEEQFVVVTDEVNCHTEDISRMEYEYDNTYYNIGVIANE